MRRILSWTIPLLLLGGLIFVVIEFGKDDGAPPPVSVEDPEIEQVGEPPRREDETSRRFSLDEGGAPRVAVPAEEGERARLEGKVTDMEGAPIADARLTLFSYRVLPAPLVGDVRPRHEEQVRAEARTGPDGRYLFEGLGDVAAPIFSLRIAAEGFSEILKDGVGPGMVVDARLERGNPLDIRVIDADTKKPIAGVKADISMRVQGSNMHEYRRWRRKVQGDSEGLVHLAGVPQERLTLFLEHPDYEWLFVRPEDEIWVKGAGLNELVFEMKKGVTIEGLVVDARTREPIRDCVVTLREIVLASRREKTGVFGKFKMTGVNRGNFEINFEADGYSRYQERLEISDAAMKDQRVFELIPAGMASGTVVNERGDPMVGAEVWVAEAKTVFRAIRDESEAVTDRQGSFSIRNLDDSRVYRVVARMPGYTLGFSADFQAISGEFVDGIIVQLERGARVQGIVSDSGGVPVAGAVVTVEQPPYSGAWFPPGHAVGQKQTLSLTTDANGYWKLEGLWPGPYQITVDHPDYIPMLPEGLRVDVGNEKIEKNFSLIEGHTIAGRVFLPSGGPAAGVEVSGSVGAFQARTTTTRTDTEGRYRLSRLLQRPYRVKALGPTGVAMERHDVPIDSQGVDFTLENYGAIEGSVLDPDSGRPIDRFVLRLYPLMALNRFDDGRASDPRLEEKLMTSHEAYVEKTVVSSEGRFSVTGVHPGEYRVAVSADDRVSMTQTKIVVNPGGLGLTRPFLLRAGATFQGLVTNSDGRPITGNELSIRLTATPNSTLETTVGPDGKPVLQKGRSPWAPREAKIDENGRFHVGGLPAGILRVQLSSPVYCCPPWEDVSFGEDGTIERDYRLVRGAKVVLNVVDQFGRPVELPSTQVLDVEGRRAKVDDRVLAARGDIRGKVEIPKIAPGRYTLEIECFGYALTRVAIDVAEGEELIRDVEMEKLAR